MQKYRCIKSEQTEFPRPEKEKGNNTLKTKDEIDGSLKEGVRKEIDIIGDWVWKWLRPKMKVKGVTVSPGVSTSKVLPNARRKEKPKEQEPEKKERK